MATYTHTGCRPQTGYVHRSDLLAGHGDYEGKVHAITGTDYRRGKWGVGYRAYLTLCGDAIQDSDDVGATMRPAIGDGSDVTCKRCRKALGA